MGKLAYGVVFMLIPIALILFAAGRKRLSKWLALVGVVPLIGWFFWLYLECQPAATNCKSCKKLISQDSLSCEYCHCDRPTPLSCYECRSLKLISFVTDAKIDRKPGFKCLDCGFVMGPMRPKAAYVLVLLGTWVTILSVAIPILEGQGMAAIAAALGTAISGLTAAGVAIKYMKTPTPELLLERSPLRDVPEARESQEESEAPDSEEGGDEPVRVSPEKVPN